MGEALTDMPAQQPASSRQRLTHLELAALPSAVACARLHAKAIALEWGLRALAENIELIVSELVTNSIRAAERPHGAGLPVAIVRLWLSYDLHGVMIRVWDSTSQMPIRQDPGPDEESGRGLLLVEHLSSEWGAYREGEGKVVWALVLCALLQLQAG
jgi:anti-sigma regulatory factor (Ser/Thr protein kinase)